MKKEKSEIINKLLEKYGEESKILLQAMETYKYKNDIDWEDIAKESLEKKLTLKEVVYELERRIYKDRKIYTWIEKNKIDYFCLNNIRNIIGVIKDETDFSKHVLQYDNLSNFELIKTAYESVGKNVSNNQITFMSDKKFHEELDTTLRRLLKQKCVDEYPELVIVGDIVSDYDDYPKLINSLEGIKDKSITFEDIRIKIQELRKQKNSCNSKE